MQSDTQREIHPFIRHPRQPFPLLQDSNRHHHLPPLPECILQDQTPCPRLLPSLDRQLRCTPPNIRLRLDGTQQLDPSRFRNILRLRIRPTQRPGRRKYRAPMGLAFLPPRRRRFIIIIIITIILLLPTISQLHQTTPYPSPCRSRNRSLPSQRRCL